MRIFLETLLSELIKFNHCNKILITVNSISHTNSVAMTLNHMMSIIILGTTTTKLPIEQFGKFLCNRTLLVVINFR
jgi:hypothetical protein